MKKTRIIGIVIIITGLVFSLFTSSEASAAGKKDKKLSLDIQGFRIGMTIAEVKQILRKKNITRYQTRFSDLFAYNPSPGTEIKLIFSCSAKANRLSRVEFSSMFGSDETELVMPKFRKKLIAKYGMPRVTDSQQDGLNFCWGQCGQQAQGTRLEARTTATQGGNKRLVLLVLSNDRIAKGCEDVRRRKINQWLYQWIGDVQKFKIGMTLKGASAVYQKRYQDQLMPDEVRDEALGQYVVRNYVVTDYDFFNGLDFESLAFEGQGPGQIVLKFSGEQAGKNSRLNKRLYYAYFSTTKFADSLGYHDTRRKLQMFINTYGEPGGVTRINDGLTAWWRRDTTNIAVTVSDSGLIIFEQSDQSLIDAYREAAVKNIRELNRTRFDSQIF